MTGLMRNVCCTWGKAPSGEQVGECPANEDREQHKHASRKSGGLQAMAQRCLAIGVMVGILLIGDLTWRFPEKPNKDEEEALRIVGTHASRIQWESSQ